MNMRPVIFSPEMSLSAALDKLLTSKQIGGPVVDAEHRVVGFLSEQDMIETLLKVGYSCQDSYSVTDCMSAQVLTANPEDSIMVLAEQMTIKKPKIYPVVASDGNLVGVISRRDVLSAIGNQITHGFQHPV
jgi:CBS domain-containing protein